MRYTQTVLGVKNQMLVTSFLRLPSLFLPSISYTECDTDKSTVITCNKMPAKRDSGSYTFYKTLVAKGDQATPYQDVQYEPELCHP